MTRPYRLLALSALLLGLLAMVVRNPREHHRVTLDVKELARMIEQEEDHVTPEELAEMLMQEKRNVRVMDTRDSAAFVSYHIPTAVQCDISRLVEASFATADTIIVYSEGGIHAAQAWMLLTVQGHRNVFTLRGGLNEWNDKILFPVVSGEMTAKERERIRKRAGFFGGEPKTLNAITMPKMVPKPSVTPNTKIPKEQEKQREIC